MRWGGFQSSTGVLRVEPLSSVCTRRQLAAMTERELQDMATCRSDVVDELGGPFWLIREIDMAKPSKEFLSPKTLIPPAGYSHIAKVNSGTIVYLAGQVSSGASGNLIGEGNFEAQVEQVFRNLKIAVEAAGGTMADIVKLNIYLVAEVDQADVPKLRAIRDRYVNIEKPPASTWSSSAGWRGRAGSSRSRLSRR